MIHNKFFHLKKNESPTFYFLTVFEKKIQFELLHNPNWQ